MRHGTQSARPVMRKVSALQNYELPPHYITTPPMNNETLKILQYNLRKNQQITESVLNHPDSKEIAIIALQEQYYSQYMKSSPTHQSWTLIEPTEQNGAPPKATIYVNKNCIPQAHITQIPIPIHDTAAISISNTNTSKPTLDRKSV